MTVLVASWPRPAAAWQRHPRWLLAAVFLCSLSLGCVVLAWPVQRALLRERVEAEQLARELAAPPSWPTLAALRALPALDSAELLAGIATAAERGGLRLHRLVVAPATAREDGTAVVLRLSADGSYVGIASFFRRLGSLPWPVKPRWIRLVPASPEQLSAPLRLETELAICCDGPAE